MSTIHRAGSDASQVTSAGIPVPLLDGQRLDSAAFLALYEQTAPDVKAELIAGVVYMGSPVGYRHGDLCNLAGFWLRLYRIGTRGVAASSDATTALDDQAVPQPDLSLRILPAYGGRTHYAGKIISGAPELVVEVSDSSRPVDLGSKLLDYERAGVLEYIVIALDPDEVFWHVRRNGRLERVSPDADGLYRSQAFPGLCLDPKALLDEDDTVVRTALDRGLATAEHAAFVAALAACAQA